MTDWRERYAGKVVSAEQAVQRIQSGQVAVVGFNLSAPRCLLEALGRRAGELSDVRLYQQLALQSSAWYEDPAPTGIRVVTCYLSPISRPAFARGTIDFDVMTVWTGTKPEHGAGRKRDLVYPDVALLSISPPDEKGQVSFGSQLWYHKAWTQRAGLVIGEVNENYIRTGGDNSVSVDAFDLLVAQPEALPLTTFERGSSGEDAPIAAQIGRSVAGLINDGDCIQIGFGQISEAAVAGLADKNDLGFHAEIMPGGIVPLVRAGNVTGARKTLDRGRHVATGFLLDAAGYEYVDGHPDFELREAHYTNNPRIIAQLDNFVSINAALAVDLTGQISSEAFGPTMFSGVAGQLDFQMGAMLSDGGRAITVLPATARGGKVSRIVGQFPEGQIISVPRTFADFIVTEYGVASLQGKTQRERAAALIEIAAPEFRDDLRATARRLYG